MVGRLLVMFGILLAIACPAVAAPIEVKVKIEIGFTDAANAGELMELLNAIGGEDNLHFQLAEDGYGFRIAVATIRSAARFGGAEGTAAVLTPDSKVLFLVARQGRFTQSGALNAVTKEIVKRLALYIKAARPVQTAN